MTNNSNDFQIIDVFQSPPSLLGSGPPGPQANLVHALDLESLLGPAPLEDAVNELSPINFANFTSLTAFNNAAFSTQLFDSYLTNLRGADGTFISRNGGIDYSGLAVNDPDIAGGLQMIRSRLLAWNPTPSTGLVSDVVNPIFGGVDMKDTKTMGSLNESTNLWNVFISGGVVLAQGFSDAFSGTSGFNSTTGNVQVGVDYRITPHFLIGALFAYGHTNATLDNLGSNATVDTYAPGIYASYSSGGWYANALASYGFSSYDQNRNISIDTFGGTATSSPVGSQVVGNLDGGYDFHKGNWTLGPTLGLQYVHLEVDGYTETGLPGANLNVDRDEADSLRSRLGGRIAYAVRDGDMTFTPRLSASWQHEFLEQSRGITAQFDGVGSGSFDVTTSNPSRESALVDLGFDAQINDALMVFTDYSVQTGQSNYFGQSIQAGVKIGF